MSRRSAVLVLCVWTFVVWTFRIGSSWQASDALGAKIAHTALAVTFTALATVSFVLAWRHQLRHPVISIFVTWTIGVWVVRGLQIAMGDHDLAFVAVHVVLALVSIGFALTVATASDRERMPSAPGLVTSGSESAEPS